mmetsp:Transcript_13890/g.25434  ORF Transcript_13890/g.25434 Transcript_13890/m.25434 type:complete len:216 (-) Transcript_13890:102-749(-)
MASTMTLSLSASSLASTASTCLSKICFCRTVFCSIMSILLFSSLSISFLMKSWRSYSIWSSIAESLACSRDLRRIDSWCCAALSLLTYAMLSFLSSSLSSSLVSHMRWISRSILSCSALRRLISVASLLFCSKMSLFIFLVCSASSTLFAIIFSAATLAILFCLLACETRTSFFAAWLSFVLSPTYESSSEFLAWSFRLCASRSSMLCCVIMGCL